MATGQVQPGLIRNRNFLMLFLGGLLSRIGNGIHYIALTWFILDVTRSGTATGLVMFLSSVPGVLLGPLAGVAADRVRRKALIVGMDLIRGTVVLGLSWMVLTGQAGVLHLGIATVLIAAGNAFYNPALGAAYPSLVHDSDLQKANSLEHFSSSFTSIIGAAIGGVLIGLVGVGTVFLLNGISYLLCAFCETWIRMSPAVQKKVRPGSVMEDLRFGAAYLYEHKDIFTLFSLSVITNFLFSGALMVGIPFVFKEVLAVTSQFYGIGQAIFPAGAVLGAVLMSLMPEVREYYRVLLVTTPVIGLAFILIGVPLLPAVRAGYDLMLLYGFLLGVLFLFGIVNSVCNIPLRVLLQRLIPGNLLGRVFGLLSSFNQGLVPISMALVGFLLDRVPAYGLFMTVGAVWLIFILWASRIPGLKTVGIRRQEVESPANG